MQQANDWQHDVVLQSLYSAKSSAKHLNYLEFSLAQARTDVFFTLLFGGRIVMSAGSLFDSPLAIRIFGELFSTSGFQILTKEYNWRPLHICTDQATLKMPAEFLGERWKNPESNFTLFRQCDPNFEMDAKILHDLRSQLHAAIEEKNFDNIKPIYEPFTIPYTTKLDALGNRDARSFPSLMAGDYSAWFKNILIYIEQEGNWSHLPVGPLRDQLDQFSPAASIRHRINSLTQNDDNEVETRASLIERLAEFDKITKSSRVMNPFHVTGPRVFEQYYSLLSHWIEMDWHAVRSNIYRSNSCIFSSDWQIRDVFDLEKNSKAYFLSDSRLIDDGSRLPQDRYSAIDWSILLGLVTNIDWRNMNRKAKSAKNSDELVRQHEEIMNFLAKKLTEFHFENKSGKYSIIAKKSSGVVGAVTGFSIVDKYVEGIFGPVLSGLGALSLSSAVQNYQTFAKDIAYLVPFITKIHEKYERHSLRRAVVPQIYFNPTKS
jgi:hypothetical protein